MKKLNLGCGRDYRKGWVNLDLSKDFKTDVVHNMNKYPYPFKPNTFDRIVASHIVEHLDDAEKYFAEMHRILKKGGELHVIVPHFTNAMAYDPTHKAYYGIKSMNHVKGKLNFKELYLTFTPKYKLIELIARRWPVFYENSPLRLFPAKEVRAVLKK